MRPLRLALCWILVRVSAQAGTLTQADVVKRFPAPLTVGARAADVPAGPLFRQNGTASALVGYAFESADLAPVPGFAGVPPNLLVVIDPKVMFLDVEVLSQHEPVFLEGLGEAPLRDPAPVPRPLAGTGDHGRRRQGEPGRRVQGDGIRAHHQPERAVRRAEGGTPCQTCRHRCGYNAIRPSGRIAYEECFQCMECVVIHASDEQCAPRILELRRGRSIPIVPASAIIDRRA